MDQDFNPRAPCGARQGAHQRPGRADQHFNPRAPCGARHALAPLSRPVELISTHAPLAGRDSDCNMRCGWLRISTHAPLAGRDVLCLGSLDDLMAFQPTRPLRGATFGDLTDTAAVDGFQPTRPLRGATLSSSSIGPSDRFQPTRPLRGATSWGAKRTPTG